MERLEVVVGMEIGWYTVVEDLQEPVNGRHCVLVKCRCGRSRVRSFSQLLRLVRDGQTPKCKSCGIAEINKRVKVKHNDCKHPLYHIWANMKERCTNVLAHDYPRYGGRGITVCDEWADSFVAFKTWAISAGWHKGLQIDRIDNNKGYCPENCRFVTARENSNNRQKTLYIDGVPSSLYFDTHDHHPSVNYRTFYSRYWRRHWELEKSLLTPSSSHN